MSIRAKDNVKDHAIEAFRRCKFKFPGQQKIIVSRDWGFTGLQKEEYQKLRGEGKLLADGVNVKVIRNKGPIA